jgi:molecular chaperone DnaK
MVGIDLGTTNSCVAAIGDDGEPLIIENQQGESTTASVVSFREIEDGQVRSYVGSPAQRMAVTNPTNTVFGIKRLIGRAFHDPEILELAETLPYAVEPAPNGDAWVEAVGRLHSPVDISAIILRELREVAEAHYGGPVREAIITVPAYFGGEQRRATIRAAELAGLQVRRLVNEPTAAALGYGAHRTPHRRFAVCDLGGGTFDVSVVSVESGVVEVISTHGNLFLGGEDFDRAVLRELVAEIRERRGVDVAGDPTAIQRLRGAVLASKHALSSTERAEIRLPYLAETDAGPLDYERTLRRDELEAWTRPVAERLAAPCREAIARCGLEMGEIDAIVLVGGMTRMPLVQRVLGEVFGKSPLRVVNPDEIVAVGAATQCAILEGAIEEVVLLDVTARSLSIGSPRSRPSGGWFQQVIPRNATIPTRERRVMVIGPGETPVFDVFEGDAPSAADNRLIGRYAVELTGPRNEAVLVIELTVDVDGILRVGARRLGEPDELRLRLIAGAGVGSAPRREIS